MRKESGFTMISVMMAVAMFGAMVLTMSKTGAAVVEAHRFSSLRGTAVAIARGHLEVIRSSDPADLVSQSAVWVDRYGQPDPGGIFSRSVTVGDEAQNLKSVRVTVDYPQSSVPIELMTLVFFRNP